MPFRQQQPKGQGGDRTDSLAAAIDAVTLAEKLSTVAPAKAVFGSVGSVLAIIRVRLLSDD